MNVLFICTGNTCRSPMAEAILKHKAPQLTVKSAGIFASNNEGANAHAVEALKEKNIQINHRSQQVTEQLIQWAHVVLTMTNNHKETLHRLFPEHERKVFTLTEYAASRQVVQDFIAKDIVDPFGGSLTDYKKTASEIEQYIEKILKKTNDKDE